MDQSFPISLFQNQDRASLFQCKICLQVPTLESAVEHKSCGNIFCKDCVEKNNSLLKNICPLCKGSSLSGNSPLIESTNKFALKVFLELYIECPTINYCKANKEHSELKCKWIGPIKDLKLHLQTCKEVVITCKLGCKAKIKVKNIEEHEFKKCMFKKVRCKYCNTVYSYNTIEGHLPQCDQNPEKIYTCEYLYMGCDFKGVKNQIEEHNKAMVQYHFDLFDKRLPIKKVAMLLSYNNSLQQCLKGHSMNQRDANKSNIRCSVCGFSVKSKYCFECNSCSHMCCWNCYYYSPTPLKCVKNSNHYLAFSYKVKGSDCCVKCKKYISTMKFHCPYCNICICYNCR